MRRGGVAAIFALGCVWSEPGIAQGITDVPYFPMRADPFVVNEQANLEQGAVLYQQTLRPLAGIRTTSPIALHYAPGGMRGLHGSLDVTIPAGTVFLSTIFDKSLYFCSAQSLQNSVLWGIVEAAVCLRDNDGNGVADQEIVLGNGRYRVQNIFELIGQQKDVPVSPVSISYEKISAAELPKLDLKMAVRPAAGLLASHNSAVVLQICAPAEISAVPKDGGRCAYVDWNKSDVVDRISVAGVGGTIKFDADNTATVKWGPLALSLQREAADAASVKAVRTVAAGVTALIGTDKLEERGGGGTAAVVSLIALPPMPALREIELR